MTIAAMLPPPSSSMTTSAFTAPGVTALILPASWLRDETFPGLLMLRPEGRVFFVNAERLGDRIRDLVDEMHPRVIALDLSRVHDLEYTALKMLIDGEQRMRDAGVDVWLVGLNPEVLEVVRRSPLAATLGRERMHFNLAMAVAHYESMTSASV